MGRESHSVLDVVVELPLPRAPSFESCGRLRKGSREIGEHFNRECESQSRGGQRGHQRFERGLPLFESRAGLTADLGLLVRSGAVKETAQSQGFRVESAQARFLRVPLSKQRRTKGER